MCIRRGSLEYRLFRIATTVTLSQHTLIFLPDHPDSHTTASMMIGVSSFAAIPSSPDSSFHGSWNHSVRCQAPQPQLPDASEVMTRLSWYCSQWAWCHSNEMQTFSTTECLTWIPYSNVCGDACPLPRSRVRWCGVKMNFLVSPLWMHAVTSQSGILALPACMPSSFPTHAPRSSATLASHLATEELVQQCQFQFLGM